MQLKINLQWSGSPKNNLVVTKNLWLILLGKVGLFLNLAKCMSKNDNNIVKSRFGKVLK